MALIEIGSIEPGGHCASPGFAAPSQGSQMSPCPSLSASAWSVFGLYGQLSYPLSTPSLSTSFASTFAQLSGFVHPSSASSGHGSQTSPLPSPSSSGCTVSIGRLGLKTFGQLSIALGTPSPSS